MKHFKHIFVVALLISTLVLSACQSTTPDDTESITQPAPAETTTVDDSESTDNSETTSSDSEEMIEVKEVVPTFGGTLRLALNAPDTLNPLENKIQSVAQALDFVYEPLFQLDESWKAEPILVESYSFSEDGKTLSIKLKEDVLFHDGTSLTSDDVLYSIELIENADYSPYANNVLGFKRVVADDAFNLTFQYDQGYAFALNDLTFPIVSSIYHTGENYNTLIPNGTGPYAFVDYQQMQLLQLKAFDGWHGGDVYVESIDCTIITEERSYETLFDQNLIDTMTPTKFNWLKYSENEEQHIDSYVSSYYDFIAFNFNNPIFEDVNLRKAFAYAIDKEFIVYDRFINHAYITDTPVKPNSWFAAQNEIVYNFNLETAVSLVSDTFEDLDNDGYYDMLDLVDETQFNRVELRMLVNADVSHRVDTAELIKNNLETIGFYITLDILPATEYYAAVEAGDFDLLYAGWKLSTKPDYVSILDTLGSQNIGKYSSELMDIVLERIIDAYTEEQVKAAVLDFEEVFVDELPYISMYFLEGAVMRHDNVYGEFKGDTAFMFRGIEDIYLDITQ